MNSTHQWWPRAPDRFCYKKIPCEKWWTRHILIDEDFVLLKIHVINPHDTVGGRNPAPVDRWFIPLFIGFQPSKVVQDFFHPQYLQLLMVKRLNLHFCRSNLYFCCTKILIELLKNLHFWLHLLKLPFLKLIIMFLFFFTLGTLHFCWWNHVFFRVKAAVP